MEQCATLYTFAGWVIGREERFESSIFKDSNLVRIKKYLIQWWSRKSGFEHYSNRHKIWFEIFCQLYLVSYVECLDDLHCSIIKLDLKLSFLSSHSHFCLCYCLAHPCFFVEEIFALRFGIDRKGLEKIRPLQFLYYPLS